MSFVHIHSSFFRIYTPKVKFHDHRASSSSALEDDIKLFSKAIILIYVPPSVLYSVGYFMMCNFKSFTCFFFYWLYFVFPLLMKYINSLYILDIEYFNQSISLKLSLL